MHRTLSLLSAVVLLLAAVSPVAAALPDTALASPPNVIPGQYIVVLRPGADRAAILRQARAIGGEVVAEYRRALNGFAARLPQTAVARLALNPEVEFIVPDSELRYSSQVLPSAVDRIDGDFSSAVAGDGSGETSVNIAILDSGIDVDHPDLNVAGGFDCVSSKKRATYDDLVGHGTLVAGSVAARDNGIGSVGVAPGAPLWAVRVGTSKPKMSAVVCGIDWVTSTRTDADPTNDIAVANMSFGAKGGDDGNCGRTKKDVLHVAICNSVSAGVTYIAGAGNDSADLAQAVPAAYDEVLTATAVADYDGVPGSLSQPTCFSYGADDSPATFSSFATLVADQAHTVAAPGTCSLSTAVGGTYGLFNGTSLAAPVTSGVVALCIASTACAGLSPSQIVHKIVEDAAAYNIANANYGFAGDPLRPPGDRYYGYLIRAALY